MNLLPGLVEPGELLPCDGSAVLHPGFIDASEADVVLHRLLTDEPWEEHSITLFGRTVPEPRRSVWHGDEGVTYEYSRTTRDPVPWSRTLDDIRSRCETVTGVRFNGVLVNLYRDGRDSMGWHADDEAVLGDRPVIASVSLGAERRFDMKHRESGLTVSAVLPHGSLLVMSGDSQSRWVHRVARTAKVAAPRVNLTFRRLLLPS